MVKDWISILTDQYIAGRRGSKTKYLHTREFQDYLQTDQLTINEKRLLYNLRVRRVSSFKENIKSQYTNNDLSCDLFLSHTDSKQDTLSSCVVIHSDPVMRRIMDSLSYKEIYGSLCNQIKAIKGWTVLHDKRKILLENMSLGTHST